MIVILVYQDFNIGLQFLTNTLTTGTPVRPF